MKRLKILTRLFLDFLCIGAFTFGGGWSIVAQMRQRYVQQQGVLRDEELLDMEQTPVDFLCEVGDKAEVSRCAHISAV